MSHQADADLCLLQINALGYDECGGDLQDSDKLIPPSRFASAPASVVPFAQAPSSMRAALGQQSTHSTHSTPSTHSAPTQASDLGRASSRDASFRSQGSVYSSEPAREGDAQPETLPHMFNKDWELNLDALEVCHHHLHHGFYPFCSPWPPPAAGT